MKCRDHLGNKFPSVRDMCIFYGIDPKSFRYRIKRGISLEKALTEHMQRGKRNKKLDIYRNKDGKIIDHIGNEFDTLKEMCQKYKINVATFMTRIKAGWNLDESLLTPTRKACDHLGNEYSSYKEMAIKYGLNYQMMLRHLKEGIPFSDILESKCQKVIVDHLGNQYPTLNDLCKTYHVTPQTFMRRLNEYGWSLEKSLLTPARKTRRSVYDHCGTKFISIEEMCLAYGITRNVYDARKRNGWPLEKILSTPVKGIKRIATDHLGNNFVSVESMCAYYGIKIQTYYYRIKKGMSIEEALTMPIKGIGK